MVHSWDKYHPGLMDVVVSVKKHGELPLCVFPDGALGLALVQRHTRQICTAVVASSQMVHFRPSFFAWDCCAQSGRAWCLAVPVTSGIGRLTVSRQAAGSQRKHLHLLACACTLLSPQLPAAGKRPEAAAAAAVADAAAAAEDTTAAPATETAEEKREGGRCA